MIKTLSYSRNVVFEGRNGMGKAAALEVMLGVDAVTLSPITTKNRTARCMIQIPAEDFQNILLQLLENHLAAACVLAKKRKPCNPKT